MPKLFVVVTALAALTVPSVAGAAQAAPPPTTQTFTTPSPHQDYVIGSVSTGNFYPFIGWSVDVRSGPSGTNPVGTFAGYYIASTYSAQFDATSVTCLNVTGSTAVIAGLGSYRSGSLNQNRQSFTGGFYATVTDNGPPIGPYQDQYSPDVVSISASDAPVAPDCRAPVQFTGATQYGSVPLYARLRYGDVVVHDAPAPTLKDQCKNGGWRNFGVFKNQGDCVSFVATGGHNLPSSPSR